MDDEHTQPANPPTPAAGGAAPLKDRNPSLWKRQPVMVAGAAALAVLLFLGLRYVAASFTHESTDDAFLDGTVVSLAPKVAGQVQKVWVSDNQPVKKGDVLVEIDPRDFQTQVAQKNAARVAAEANVKLLLASIEYLGTQVATAEATAKQSEAQAAANQAVADKTGADLRRADDLIRKQIISPQEYDAAKAAAASADATLKAGREKAASDRSRIGETRAELEAGRRAWERSQAQAAQSDVDVQQANLNFSYTHILAPQDGRVTRKAVEEGDYVQVGQRLMALVSDDLYVTANFKETQLRNIRTNQAAIITVDSVGRRRFAGHVQSIQAGSGGAFSLLPPENAVGNYVKVVQRVPVKILFDQPVETGHVLGPGMSVEPSVRVAGFEVPDVVVAIAAILLAIAAWSLWSRAANRKKPAV